MESCTICSARRWQYKASTGIVKVFAAMAILLVMMGHVHHAEAVSPRRLVEVDDIGNPVVSPDGGHVAYRVERASVERNMYDSFWYVQRMDGESPPLRVADGGTPLRNSAGSSLRALATWSPDGRWIYYRALMGGRIDVWRAAADGSGAEPITLDAADVRDFSLSADGYLLKYSVGASRADVTAAEQAEYDRGIRIDEGVPVGAGLFRSANFEGRLATQRYTGSWFDRDFLLADTPVQWKSVDLRSRVIRNLGAADVPLTPLGPTNMADGSEPPWRLAHDPIMGRIALLTRTGNGEGLAQKPGVQLSMLPSVGAHHPIACASDLCIDRPISGIQWRPNSNEVLFTVSDPDEGQAQTIFRWDVETGEVREVVGSTGLLSGGRDAYSECGDSAAALACVTSDANTPPRLERIDLESGERRVLFAPNETLAREYPRSTVAQLLRWQDSEGRKFTGQFFSARIEGNDPPPLFLTYYSCPGFLRGGVGDEWPLASLAVHGIAALCVNQYREFPIDAVERYDIALSAVASVVDLLVSAGEVDRRRIGMGGLSFGTEVTMWTLVHSDLLAAASVSSPVLSPTYYLMGSLKGDDFISELHRTWQIGSPEDSPDRWKLLSPALNIDRIRSPLLMQMPEQEYLYAIDYSIPLLRIQKADLYVFPHEPHLKFQPRHKLHAYERNLDWFRFWLQGFEDDDFRKVDQYKRWRAMREQICANAVEDGGAMPWHCRVK